MQQLQAVDPSRTTVTSKVGFHGKLVLAVAGLFVALALSACSKSYPNCDDDSTCRSRQEVCVDGLCRQCGNNSHCTKVDACLTCSANECVKRTGCCKSDVDCPSGKCWRGEGEATGQCGGVCQNNDHCPAGQRCANGACVPEGCSGDSSCPSGQRCVDGKCTAQCQLEPVYFDFNESAIRLDQERVASANAECIRSNSTNIKVEGHCDERGSDEYNMALGQRRANSLNSQYKTLGVPAGLMKGTISYGEEKPVCSDSDESCWQRNRRAETARQ
jgi:peptidoglycan-associated lipoprotein